MASFPVYRAHAPEPLDIDLTTITLGHREEQTDPRNYIPDHGLVDAVNVALLLGQPLLLTGEPGTGKTQLAYSLAWQLGFADKPLKFETKSTSTARDLFYNYDTVGRFHAAQTNQGSQENIDYIYYDALGIALLRANDEHAVRHLIPKGDFVHGGQRRSLVLIDEIDKAPRDFPNDILNEVEGMYCRIPELGNKQLAADKAFRPILILTSNSEKHLPDAFLRRCIYYNIPFPDKDSMRKIVEARLGRFVDTSLDWFSPALELFYELRDPNSGLIKKPATAELLNWLTTVSKVFEAEGVRLTAESLRTAEIDDPVDVDGDKKMFVAEKSLCALVKLAEDRDRGKAILKAWAMRSAAKTS